MTSIFDVDDAKISALSPQDAVEFIRELMWAEATSLGLPTTKVRIQKDTNLPDEGVDGFVDMDISVTSPIFHNGENYYQIKTGTSFKPWTLSDIKTELFHGDIKKENLSELLQHCFDSNGSYVLVCTNSGLDESRIKQAKENLISTLQQCGYTNPNVDVFSAGDMVGILKKFPSLSLQINERSGLDFHPHLSWNMMPGMGHTLQLGAEQAKIINEIQTALRKNIPNIHVRMSGAAGIGKTRLALEATNVDDLRPLVLYVESADRFIGKELESVLRLTDNKFSAILVIDECDQNDRAVISRNLHSVGDRIKLVTIYREDDSATGLKLLEVSRLDDEHIKKILETYIDPELASHYTSVCDGNAMMAHHFGNNLRNREIDPLIPPSTINIWDNIISCGEDLNSDEVKRRKTVLEHLSLFKKFGYEEPYTNEMQSIAKLIESADSSITRYKFQEIIDKLKRKKILQGKSTLYITPHPLHVKLWRDWWNVHKTGFDFNSFVSDFPESLRQWFMDMLKYAHDSSAAQDFAEELLGESGPFKNEDFLETPEGSNFFFAIAKAAPKAALNFLQRTIGNRETEQLFRFEIGRREVVWTLERLVRNEDFFQDSSELLLKLAIAENESYGNNATNVFLDLFKLGVGKVAPTQVPPLQRYKIIEKLLDSSEKQLRKFGLKACESALEVRYFSRIVSVDPTEIQQETPGWTPKSKMEILEAYQKIIDVVWTKFDTLSHDEQLYAVKVLLAHSRGLIQIPKVSEVLLDRLYKLSSKHEDFKEEILKNTIQILHFDSEKLERKTRDFLEDMKQELTGKSFHGLMIRYVKMEPMVDILGGDVNVEEIRGQEIKKLAQQSLENDNLKNELSWLVTTDAKFSGKFGYELGQVNTNFDLLPLILEANCKDMENISMFFLSGYFRSIFENNVERWEDELEKLSQDKFYVKFVPEITLRSGMTDRGALRVLDLAKKGIIPQTFLKNFRYGSAISPISEDVFVQWIDYLLKLEDPTAVFTALELFDTYYIRKDKKLPEELTFRLLTHSSILDKPKEVRFDTMDDFYWKDIGFAFIEKYPKKSLELFEKVFPKVGFYSFFNEHSQSKEVLDRIIKEHPLDMSSLIIDKLDSLKGVNAFEFRNWLKGGMFNTGGSIVELLPLEKLLSWIDKNPKKRAKLISETLVPVLNLEKNCKVREILKKYGDQKEVRLSLLRTFSEGVFMGSEVEHYQNKLNNMKQLYEQETEPNVRLWIKEYISSLEKDVKRAERHEERWE